MRYILTILFLAATAFAQGTGYKTQDCGLNKAFTTAACGNVGDPWDGGGQPASTVTVSAADQTYNAVTANAVYRFSGNITAADSTCANGIEFTGGVGPLTIDLNGTTYTGVICITARYLAGVRVVNGTITCSVIASGTVTGCIRYLATTGGDYTGIVQFDHLTVTNTADPGAGSAHGIYSEITPASCVTSPVIRFNNLTITSATATTAARVVLLRTVASVSATGNTCGARADHNNLTCAADTSACQGIDFLYQYAPTVENNYINMVQNTTAATGRAINIDNDNNSTNYCTLCAGAKVRNNIVDANNNRAIRNRGSATMLAENNKIYAIKGTAIHVGDATSPQGDYLNQSIKIQNNLLEIGLAGIGIWGRGITGVLGRNNNFTCHSGGCGTGRAIEIATPTGVMATTTFDFQNNTVSASIGAGASCTAGTATNSCALATTTAQFCGSGTFSGAGTQTDTSPCP
jgi:hypothetical protein